MSGQSDHRIFPMESSKGIMWINMDTHKWENGGKIKSKGNYNHFIVRQVALLGVSDNCVKKNQMYALSP